ncbi:MAG: hypothetical protein LBB65_02620 [Burkholderiales bacterium]|jgi:hypothetical protein|nr:hypothetical protein [Burkholderiales bacterium]
MVSLPSPRSAHRATRLREKLESFANGLAIVLGVFALVVAAVWWVWYALGPKPAHIPPPPIESPATVLRATPLFGSAPAASAEKVENVVLGGELRLLGVIAEKEGRGYAVFRMGQSAGQGVYIAQTGDEVAGQATLTRIEPNAAILREPSGAERRLLLRPEEKGSNAGTSATGKASLAASSNADACVPANFKGGIVRLNTELLQGALMQPETFYALLEAKFGGLVVRIDNGHTAMLGLRGGDVLLSANGIALTRVEDVSATMLKPLANGQSVLLKGKRGDQMRELLLVNASVCRG